MRGRIATSILFDQPAKCPRHESNMRTRFRKQLAFRITMRSCGLWATLRASGLEFEHQQIGAAPLTNGPPHGKRR